MRPSACPCCGRDMPPGSVDPRAIVGMVNLSETQRRVALHLAAHFGAVVTTRSLVDATWGDTIDGGPERDRQNIAVHVHRIRKRLIPHGITIEGVLGHGGGRRMVWLPQISARAA